MAINDCVQTCLCVSSDDAKDAAAGRDDAADEGPNYSGGDQYYKASPQAYRPLQNVSRTLTEDL